MPASQEFRDGAATGAALLAKRARTLMSWGVQVDDRMLDRMAEGLVAEYGGRVMVHETYALANVEIRSHDA